MQDSNTGSTNEGDLFLERALDLWLDRNNKARQLAGPDKALPETQCKVFRLSDYRLKNGHPRL